MFKFLSDSAMSRSRHGGRMWTQSLGLARSSGEAGRIKCPRIISEIRVVHALIGTMLFTMLTLLAIGVIRYNAFMGTEGEETFLSADDGDILVQHLRKKELEQLGGVATAASHDDRPAQRIDMVENELGTEVPYMERRIAFPVKFGLPLVAGFFFGFVGSIPVAGPTSAMVLKLGIQGKYWAGQAVGVGGALMEALYAGLAFWGFGSFLSHLEFLIPFTKLIAAVILMLVGVFFFRFEMQSGFNVNDTSPENSVSRLESNRTAAVSDGADDGTAAVTILGQRVHKKVLRELGRNLAFGMTLSAINPALFATYTGAIAAVHSTGLLEFTKLLAVVFALGVCSGISTWFFLLLSLLKKYKQRMKSKRLGHIMKVLGVLLFLTGVIFLRTSILYYWTGGKLLDSEIGPGSLAVGGSRSYTGSGNFAGSE